MSTPQHRPKNWLLLKIREWHTWAGVALSGFVVLVCATGIWLNHKDAFGAPEKEKPEAKKEKSEPQAEGGPKEKGKKGGKEAKEPKPEKGSGLLTTETDLAQLPVGFQQAIDEARAKYGAVPIEAIELKEEHGKLMYKVRLGKGREVRVDATSGEAVSKGAYQKEAGGGYEWNKIIKDLHTGKIADLPGKLVADFTSFVIIVLTVSGIYLWAVPILRRRRSARQKAAALAAASTDPVASTPVEALSAP